jgi:hypothetical protein
MSAALSVPLLPHSSISGPRLCTASFYCESCANTTQFVGISRAVRITAVSRSTIYNWMNRGWVHWRCLPSGRRVICLQSLSHPAQGRS